MKPCTRVRNSSETNNPKQQQSEQYRTKQVEKSMYKVEKKCIHIYNHITKSIERQKMNNEKSIHKVKKVMFTISDM